MAITETFIQIADTLGIPNYFSAEGDKTSSTEPAINRYSPHTDDCDSIAIAGSASADLVAASAGNKQRVYAITLSADAACNLIIQSGGATDVFGPVYLATNSTHSVSLPTGLFESASGEKLNVVLGGSANYSVSARVRELRA